MAKRNYTHQVETKIAGKWFSFSKHTSQALAEKSQQMYYRGTTKYIWEDCTAHRVTAINN